MSSALRTRVVNPRLGTYFGIFASAFAGLFLLVLIGGELGADDRSLRWAMLTGPLVLFAVIGMASMTREPIEFFAAGRRVPASYAGLGLAATALGATGLVALPGVFFVIGFDALYIVNGALAGFVLMAVLIAPFVRKFGTFTLPSYLGRRFESRTLRLCAAALLVVPMVLMLAAELSMAAKAGRILTGSDETTMIALFVVVLILSLTLGGVRSLTWTSVAHALTMLIALMASIAIVATLVTNLPVPQLTHGPLLRTLVRNEILQGVPTVAASPFAFNLPGEGMYAIAKRFTEPFGSIGPFAFVMGLLGVMTGVAASPWLLGRVATTPGVYETRKSLGWATVFFGVVMLTIASIAVFMRTSVTDIVAVAGAAQIPPWFDRLRDLGFAAVDTSASRLTLASFALDRDSVLYSLPVANALPNVFLYLTLAGAIAAALAAASAAIIAAGNILTEDVMNGMTWEPASRELRVMTGRFALALFAIVGGLFAIAAPTDPLRLVLWALTLNGAGLFCVLVLSVWWKRMNTYGATAGLISGFSVAVLAILIAEAKLLGLDSAVAGVLGLPASIAACVIATLMTPKPGRHVLELVRDIRVPGGEIIYDREDRLRHLKRRQRGA